MVGPTGVDGAAVTVITAQELEPTLEPGHVPILFNLVVGVLVLDLRQIQDVVIVNAVSKSLNVSWQTDNDSDPS